MALQSRLFRGDAKLEAAAVSDPGHVVPGASGPHVAKIQHALNELDGASLREDQIYGPATAAAVLAYKRKRNIINRSYQTQADNIVGKMTIAAMDLEMLANENLPRPPVFMRPVFPAPGVAGPSEPLRRPTVLLGFKIDVDVPLDPGGGFFRIRLAPRSTGVVEIVNGRSGQVICTNVTPVGDIGGKTGWIYEPGGIDDTPPIRLAPEPSGPVQATGDSNGGRVRVLSDPLNMKVDAYRPGNAHIVASTATSSSTVILEVRAPKLGKVAAGQPPTKTRPGSKFISADGEPNITQVSGGRPVNPIGSGRMINLGGEQETAGFEDYTVNLPFSGYNRSWTGNKDLFRPWTEDPQEGVKAGEASDICIRGTPVHDDTIAVIRRIARSGCRLTFSGGAKFVPLLKKEFNGAKILEEFSDAIVMELP